jgi:hypothetical protein
MKRTQVETRGMSATPLYAEGDAQTLYNLRKKDGALQPVTPRSTLWGSGDRYSIVFLHRGDSYQHWIGAKFDGYNRDLLYWGIDSNDPQPLGIMAPGSSVTGIAQTGNLLTVMTTTGLYYAVCKNGRYIWLGKLPPAPVFRLMLNDALLSVAYEYGWVYSDDTPQKGEFISNLPGLVLKAMDWYVHGGEDISGDYHAPMNPSLFDAHLVQAALRLFDGSLVRYGPPVLLMSEGNILDLKKVTYKSNSSLMDFALSNISVAIKGFKFIVGGVSVPSPWADIVKSVDLFISPPLALSDMNNMRTDYYVPGDNSTITVRIIDALTPELIDRVRRESRLYLFHSFPVDGEATWGAALPASADEVDRIRSIEQAEMLPVDTFSGNDIVAAGDYTYNSRLHLYDLKTLMFEGFSAYDFGVYSAYNGVAEPAAAGSDFVIETELMFGNTVEYAYRRSSGAVTHLGALLSYPDPRAKRMTVYRVESAEYWKKALSVPLTPHEGLPIAFYLDPELKPLQLAPAFISEFARDTAVRAVSHAPNIVKVSELENPFRWPNEMTYPIGSGRILAIASNVMHVSEWNYGTYPLFVFATDGVWTMQVGTGEVVYTRVPSLTSDETPVSGVVCPTPYGVAFISRRGLMLVNGQQMGFLSAPLDGRFMPAVMETCADTEGVLPPMPQESFADFLESTRVMVYDPYEAELTVADGRDAATYYNYVYSFRSQMFYLSSERIDRTVINTFPELYVIEAKSDAPTTVKSYALEASPLAHTGLVTRPIMFGGIDIKRLERLILRGLLYDIDSPVSGKEPVFVIYHSMDGVHFSITRGLRRSPGSYKDIDMGLMARSKFRYYAFAAGFTAERQTSLYLLDAALEEEYNNSKLR